MNYNALLDAEVCAIATAIARCWTELQFFDQNIFLLDNGLAIHCASPDTLQLLTQSLRKLAGMPLPDLLSYFSLNIEVIYASPNLG
ncbi:MAG: hypothetical protein ACSLEL_02285 [Candidatus Malihini olakiniferum]